MNKLHELVIKMKEYEHENNILHTRIEQLNKDIHNLKDKNKSFDDEIESYINENDELQEQVIKYKKLSKKSKSSASNDSSDIQELRNEISKLTLSSNAHQTEMKQKEVIIKDLKQELKDKSEEIKTLSEQIKQLHLNMNRLEHIDHDICPVPFEFKQLNENIKEKKAIQKMYDDLKIEYDLLKNSKTSRKESKHIELQDILEPEQYEDTNNSKNEISSKLNDSKISIVQHSPLLTSMNLSGNDNELDLLRTKCNLLIDDLKNRETTEINMIKNLKNNINLLYEENNILRQR
jgi:predicted RNase H-like nuclease (RuvC/YqgF family)